jgi:hypothetical protein
MALASSLSLLSDCNQGPEKSEEASVGYPTDRQDGREVMERGVEGTDETFSSSAYRSSISNLIMFLDSQVSIVISA